jgi:hypothetical protein
MNPDFWADNQDEINEKWEAMKAGFQQFKHAFSKTITSET